jgi:hypothetical protein
MAKRGFYNVYAAFSAARLAMQHARGRTEDNGWSRSGNWYDDRKLELATAEQKYAKAREEWEAAGCPTPKRKRKRG